MKSRVREKHQTKVFNYVKDAIALFDGDSLSMDKYEQFKEIVYVLGNLIDLPPLKSNNQEKRRFISSALKKAKNYANLNLNNFLRRVDVEYNNYLKQPRKKYYVVFTNNVKYSSYRGKRLFRVLNTPIKIHNFSYINRNFQFEKKTWDDLRLYDLFDENAMFNLMGFSYFVIEENAVDENSAFYLANRKKELLRAILNYCETYMKVEYRYGKQAPLSEIQPSKLTFIFDEEKKYRTFWYTTGEFEYRMVRLERRVLDGCLSLLKKFNSLKDNELKDILIESLLRYNYALDEYISGSTFIYFWQILEYIALNHLYDITQKDVCNRIKTITAIRGTREVWRDIVDAIYEKRNYLIHEGRISDYTMDDINLIRLICQLAVDFLFYFTNKLESKERLDFFYRNYNLNRKDFRRRKEVLKHIKKLRKY